ncbi:hypothetical protein IHE55_09580 [Streptomyces pactum]|uniref:PqqD family protein n=1 Tax=Streptomyces pactum TaxID=68249 RepID=A0ABS0NIM0_9ACTN|nr:hypothetical protein [Streptomyces pactum]MBH5335030.1 hypothetical protein [Streptomyces pactum]
MGTLRFAPHLGVARVPGEGVHLVSERGVTVLRGRAAEVLAPLLDGTREADRVLADAAREIPAGTAARVLARLRAAGLVYESTADRPPGPSDAYWSLAGLAPPAAVPLDAATAPDPLPRPPAPGPRSSVPHGPRARSP